MSSDTGSGGASAAGNNNPFEMDVDFEKVKNRRQKTAMMKQQQQQQQQQGKSTVGSSASFDEQNLLSGMDANDDTVVAPVSSRRTGGVGGGPRLGLKLFGRSSTHHQHTQSLGGSTNEQQSHDTSQDPNDHDPNEEKEELLYGGKRVTQWPYDDYHIVQQKYYVQLEEQKQMQLRKEAGLDPLEEDTQQQQSNTPTGIARGLFSRRNRKNRNNNGNNRNESSTPTSASASSMPIFSRPPDPPDIPTAVKNLSLSDFESKAEERAIAIVSTWLFDAGLIDELLVNGGMNTSLGLSSVDSTNNKQSEGIEIGAHGFPIEGASKMDKEINKLRTTTQRQLALINARLNDGVAASGTEVQELVNAVTNIKDDLGQLRELSSYISSSSNDEDPTTNLGSHSNAVANQFLLTRYPKLKKAINARRNLGRCFRELDFYSQIPVTCDRLREDLHSGEWTAHEWTTLRNVSREHVELEIFLVEAEAGMKKRIDEERRIIKEGKDNGMDDDDENNGGGGRNRYSLGDSNNNIHNYEEVDHFLSEHVKNVWELGDEIRLRIMSGIGTAFELSMNNPAGMVALVEAVEAYETANEEYKTVHGEEAGSRNQSSLRFTDMRASALKQIYQDFELRGLEVFREVQMSTENDADEDEDASNAIFSSVLRAANGLTSEIGFVQNQMSPCFPPFWALETLWCTCVAHVCSKQILDQIGGAEGHKLPDLTVTQLLDLVAWVENFRETIEESFPNIGEYASKKTYFHERPELLMENSKEVDLDVAKDSLAWANNMLWEVHDLAKDEFLYRTKEQTDEWLDNVYEAEHTKNQTTEGRLITSLCEDVYSLAGVQLRTIRERLTRRSEALVQAVGVIFKTLFEKQMIARDSFLVDLETCCAAANDFVRMSEKCEEILEEILEESKLSPAATEALEEQSAILLGLYSSDAVFAAQRAHVYIFEPIEEAIAGELFGPEWIETLTHNELALTLVRTLEDFMGDLEVYLDDLMVGKAVDALVTGTVIFYIKFLLRKAALHKDNKRSAFGDNQKALDRMSGDIRIMKDYFVSLVPSYPSSKRVIEYEFGVLDTFYELLAIASGLSQSSERDFVLVLQKRVRNIPITKFVVGDLWHLVDPVNEKKIYDIIDTMEEELTAVAPTDELAMRNAQDRKAVPGLRLDQVLAKCCDENNKRNRPGLKKTAAEQTENMLSRWRETWVDSLEDAKAFAQGKGTI